MFKIIEISTKEMELVRRLPIRAADVQELETHGLGKKSWQEMLRQAIGGSEYTLMWLYDTNEPIVIYGFAKAGNMGVPWMVGSDKIRNHKKVLMRAAKLAIDKMFDQCNTLANFVDSRNHQHIAWLRRMGFLFHPEFNIDILGVPFLYFYKRKENHV